ncbi:ATP-binding protein [Poseidonocella sp. HB161398]|uniref:ATP-binding protein n=1 Tax=Poseidonocella sp. HB161398 TaxID=2320855 RepID=UPI001108DC02|nr:HAMP domain-containing sensor histidine kinase [Poseidonocella sp. HB161398]
MSAASLRLRLGLAGAVTVLFALGLAALGLSALFATHAERRAEAELAVHLDQLLAGLARPAGALEVAIPPGDPRFERPYGGLYWQIAAPGGTLLRSRSLWDAELALPPPGDGAPHVERLAGPDGAPVLALLRGVVLPEALGGGRAVAAVALETAEIDRARAAFTRDMLPYLAILALALILAGWAQIAVGLRPLGALRQRIGALRRGREARMGGGWPAELRALTGEIDALLDAHDRDVARARDRAADLAHGLKTPLQALLGEAARLAEAGETAAAEGIEALAAEMRRHVDRELVRARSAAAPGTARAPLAPAAERVLSVIRRTPDGAARHWQVEIAEGLDVALGPDELAELLGPVLENAARHAVAVVRISARALGGAAEIAIRDDGPGLPADRLEAMTRRGMRLDESGGGSGLGLAIASEIAEAAGGRLSLVRPGGAGLEVRISLPLAEPPPPGTGGEGALRRSG